MSIKMKRNLLILLAVLAVAALLIVWANNYSITLRKAGLREPAEIYRGFDFDGRQIRVIRAETGDGSFAAVLMTKKRLGVWEITLCDIADELRPDWAHQFWVTKGGSVFYDGSIEKIGAVQHYVLCGNNAVNPIYFENGQLPANAMVDFCQDSYDGDYWVHITWCDLPGTDHNYAVEVYQALVDNGCIQPER